MRFFGRSLGNLAAVDVPKRKRAFAPHCDQSILHAPGTCQYCDHYPDWQQYRETALINFSNTNDPHKAPCPSVHFRQAETRDRWGGNVAKPE